MTGFEAGKTSLSDSRQFRSTRRPLQELYGIALLSLAIVGNLCAISTTVLFITINTALNRVSAHSLRCINFFWVRLICLAEVCWVRKRSTIMVHRPHPGLCFLGSRQQMPVIPIHYLARKLTVMSMHYRPRLKVPLPPFLLSTHIKCQSKQMIKLMNTSCISDTSVWEFLHLFPNRPSFKVTSSMKPSFTSPG